MVEDVPQPPPRGRPFEPGNPGRPPGSKNKVTRLMEELMADEVEKIGRKVVERALQGDPKCLQLCVDRLAPRRQGRPIDFQLPPINSIHDVVAAMAAISRGVNEGELTAEEAAHLVRFIEVYAKAHTTHELVLRIEELETKVRQLS